MIGAAAVEALWGVAAERKPLEIGGPAACIRRLRNRYRTWTTMSFAQMDFGQTGLEISDLDMELADTTLVPDLRKCAILLDIDGTILDLAPSPQQVWVPTGLRQTLARLDTLTGGALALVSGRSLRDIDLIFSPLELAAIGGHGAELRATAERRAGDAGKAAERRVEAPARRHCRTRARHPRRGQRLFAGAALSAGAGEGRSGARRGRQDLRRAAAGRPSRSCPASSSSRSSRPASTRPMRCAN